MRLDSAHTSSESGENRTLTAQGKNLARCLYATDSLSANLWFDNECHSKYTSPIGWWARTESNGLAEARRLRRKEPSEDEPQTQKREKPPRFPGRLSLKNQYKNAPFNSRDPADPSGNAHSPASNRLCDSR